MLITLLPDTSLPAVAEHEPVELVCAPVGVWHELQIDGMALVPYTRPGETLWRWQWNAHSGVGSRQVVLIIRFADGATEQRRWALDIQPRKIDRDRYHMLVDDLQRLATALALGLRGGAIGAERDTATARLTPLEAYYAIFDEPFAAFVRAVERIAARPREQLRQETVERPLSQIDTLSGEDLARLASGRFEDAPAGVADALQEAIRQGGGLLPQMAPARHARPTFDTYEHQLIKHLLGTLAQLARTIAVAAEAALAGRTAHDTGPTAARWRSIAAGVVQAQQTLRTLRALPLFAGVGALAAFRGATPLLQRDTSYRQVYRMWQAMRQAPLLAPTADTLVLPLAELPLLYERWCLLAMVEALLEAGADVHRQRLLQAAEDDPVATFTLPEHAPLLEGMCCGVPFVLRYQPRYRPGNGSLDRHTRVPDVVLELGTPAPALLVFDAKYRLDAAHGVPEDALADAYSYLAAIGREGRPAVARSLILYPGSGQPEYYASGAGSVPLLPGGQRGPWLAALINAIAAT